MEGKLTPINSPGIPVGTGESMLMSRMVHNEDSGLTRKSSVLLLCRDKVRNAAFGYIVDTEQCHTANRLLSLVSTKGGDVATNKLLHSV